MSASPRLPRPLPAEENGSFNIMYTPDPFEPVALPLVEALRMDPMDRSKNFAGRARKGSSRSGRSAVLPTPGQLLVAKTLDGFPPEVPWGSEAVVSTPRVSDQPPERQPDVEALQQLDRRPLIDWAENLYLDYSKLKQEHQILQKTLDAAHSDLGQALSHIDELKLQAAQGVTHSTENADLRKQLAAYAVEIDVLREEKARYEQTTRDAQDTVHQLSIEREGLVRSLHDLDRLHSDKAAQLRHLENLMDEKAKEASSVQDQLRASTGEMNDSEVPIKSAEEHCLTIQLAESEKAHRQTEKLADSLGEVIRRLTSQLEDMQERFVKQTRDFATFVKTVRLRQHEAKENTDEFLAMLGQEIDRQKELPDYISRLQTRFERFVSKHLNIKSSLLASQQELQTQVSEAHEGTNAAINETARATMALAREEERQRIATRVQRAGIIWCGRILPQMIIACHEGAVLTKVSDRNGSKDMREAWVCPDSMSIKWHKYPSKGGFTDSTTTVPLDRIIQIGFGCSTRAYILYPDNPPWHCWAIHTIDRSYDFICKEPKEAEAFVLSVSRMCARIAWPVPGSIPTRRRFLAIRGWCKVEWTCRKKNKTLLAALRDVTVNQGASLKGETLVKVSGGGKPGLQSPLAVQTTPAKPTQSSSLRQPYSAPTQRPPPLRPNADQMLPLPSPPQIPTTPSTSARTSPSSFGGPKPGAQGITTPDGLKRKPLVSMAFRERE